MESFEIVVVVVVVVVAVDVVITVVVGVDGIMNFFINIKIKKYFLV